MTSGLGFGVLHRLHEDSDNKMFKLRSRPQNIDYSLWPHVCNMLEVLVVRCRAYHMLIVLIWLGERTTLGFFAHMFQLLSMASVTLFLLTCHVSVLPVTLVVTSADYLAHGDHGGF